MTRSLTAFTVLLLVLALASCSQKPEYAEAPASGDEIRISSSMLEEGSPVFHSFHHEGTRIDYFVLKINGRVEAHFDACAKCYPEKRGYRAESGQMVCLACGQRFDMDNLKGFGSCHPLPIEVRIEGDSYVIDKEELKRGARYF